MTVFLAMKAFISISFTFILLLSLLISANSDINDKIVVKIQQISSDLRLNFANESIIKFVKLVRYLAIPLIVLPGFTQFPISLISGLQKIIGNNIQLFIILSEAIVIIVFLLETQLEKTNYLSKTFFYVLYYVSVLVFSLFTAIIYVFVMISLSELHLRWTLNNGFILLLLSLLIFGPPQIAFFIVFPVFLQNLRVDFVNILKQSAQFWSPQRWCITSQLRSY